MMKNDTTYNGWSNKQTWALNLRYEGCFESMAEEQEFDDVNHMASAMEALVDELEYDGLKEGSLAYDAVGEYLDAVNWEELAGKWFQGGEISDDDAEHLAELRDMLAAE